MPLVGRRSPGEAQGSPHWGATGPNVGARVQSSRRHLLYQKNTCGDQFYYGHETGRAGRLQARYARRAGPIGLTVEKLDFEHNPSKNGFPGIPVKAWIRFPDCAELVDGEVYAWTAKAAEVTWDDGPVTYRTWVWRSSGVTRREEMMNRNLGERTHRDSSSD